VVPGEGQGRPSAVQTPQQIRAGVTISGKSSDDLAPGTLNSIFKQAGSVDQDMKEVH